MDFSLAVEADCEGKSHLELHRPSIQEWPCSGLGTSWGLLRDYWEPCRPRPTLVRQCGDQPMRWLLASLKRSPGVCF